MKLKGRSKEKKLLSWRETWKINLCAVKLIYARYPGALISRIVRVIFAALSPYVGIYLSARIIDEIAGARDTERLIHLVLTALFAAAAISLFNSLLSQWCNVENADRYFKNNHILTRKMLEMDFISVDDTKTHEMLSTILQNQNSGGWGLNRTIGLLDGIISSFFTLTGGFALTATLFTSRVPENSSLAVLNQPLSVLLILALMVSVTCLAPVLSTKANSFWAKKSNLHNESNRSFGFFGFLGYKRELAPDVRIYRQDRLCQKYNMDKRGTFAPKGVFAEYARGKGGLLNAASAAVSVIFTGLVYLFVCLKSWAGAFGVGAVTQYVASVTALAGSISSILTTAGDMRNNASFLKLILDFLDIPNSMYKGSLTVEKRSDNRYEIEFRNVSFRYPGAEAYALKDVSLVFQTGERLAVVGMNGSGKTTFIKLLCRLYDPTEGEILLNGINIQKYDYFEYMSIFSVVFQDFKLFSFTVGQNVAAKLAFDREKVESCLQKAGFAQPSVGDERRNGYLAVQGSE